VQLFALNYMWCVTYVGAENVLRFGHQMKKYKGNIRRFTH